MQLISRIMILLLASTAAHAAIVRPIDEKKVLEVPIPQGELTRIKVENDRILQVFGLAGEYVLETDDHQGQIFIRPIEGLKPINLTITTEAGHTQDLRLIPKDKPPQALILKVDTEIAQELEREKQASAPLFREEVEELIHACQEGRIPLGYKEVPLDLSTFQACPREGEEPRFNLLLREIQGQKLRGLTYRIQNNSQEPLVLSEPEFAASLTLKPKDLIALLIFKKTLNPGEGTDVYVALRAN